MTPLEYRQTRAAIRDVMSRCLDLVDGTQAALAHGDAVRARVVARELALAADDLTALTDRLVRHITHVPEADTRG